MQEYIYHMVPKELIGHKLIPLNSLKKTYPKGKPFGLFPYIPHLLSLGEIDVKDVEIITWNRFSDD